MINVKPEIIESMRERIEEQNRRDNRSPEDLNELKIQEAITDIHYQVSILEGSFTAVWMDFKHTTTLDVKSIKRVKEQSIKMINKSDTPFYK